MADESQWGFGKDASHALLEAPAEFRERASEGKMGLLGIEWVI
jgi:hypothetical protein